jgi:hypothetical protein
MRLPLIAVISVQLIFSSSLAYSKSKAKSIPDPGPKPEIPQMVKFESKVDEFGCKRPFLYRGQTAEVDSHHKKDGEKLRSIIEGVPEAVSELNEYQLNRRRVQTSAIVGSIGLVVLLGSLVVAGEMRKSSTANLATADTIGRAGLITGAVVGAGTLLYSFGVLYTNESHLSNAAKAYNKARPEDPIELKFSAGLLF